MDSAISGKFILSPWSNSWFPGRAGCEGARSLWLGMRIWCKDGKFEHKDRSKRMYLRWCPWRRRYETTKMGLMSGWWGWVYSACVSMFSRPESCFPIETLSILIMDRVEVRSCRQVKQSKEHTSDETYRAVTYIASLECCSENDKINERKE